MAKFIIGVVVGIFLGASVGAYGAAVAGPRDLDGVDRYQLRRVL